MPRDFLHNHRQFADLIRIVAEAQGIAPEGVAVPVYSVAKTVADTFRHRRALGLDLAIQGLREALRKRKATPAEIADHAIKGRAYSVMRPYLEAFAADEA